MVIDSPARLQVQWEEWREWQRHQQRVRGLGKSGAESTAGSVSVFLISSGTDGHDMSHSQAFTTLDLEEIKVWVNCWLWWYLQLLMIYSQIGLMLKSPAPHCYICLFRELFPSSYLMVSTGVGDQSQREFEATFGGSLDVFSEGSNLWKDWIVLVTYLDCHALNTL